MTWLIVYLAIAASWMFRTICEVTWDYHKPGAKRDDTIYQQLLFDLLWPLPVTGGIIHLLRQWLVPEEEQDDQEDSE